MIKPNYSGLFRFILLIAALLLAALITQGNSNAKQRTTIQQYEGKTTKLEEQLKKLQQEKEQLNKKVSQSKRQQVAKQNWQQVSYSVGCEKYRAEISKYGWNVDIAMNVMYTESGCNPNAVSSTDDHGLFQLHSIPIYDPAKNIAYAYYNKYLAGGWGHWTVCTRGIINCW